MVKNRKRGVIVRHSNHDTFLQRLVKQHVMGMNDPQYDGVEDFTG